jgi:hypothetical protein
MYSYGEWRVFLQHLWMKKDWNYIVRRMWCQVEKRNYKDSLWRKRKRWVVRCQVQKRNLTYKDALWRKREGWVVG